MEQIEDFLQHFNSIKLVHKQGTKKKYYNVAMSFDIET